MKKNIIQHAALTLAAALSGNSFADIPTISRNDYKSYGYNKKKCKSCVNFNHCKMTINKRPLDNACKEYIKKKK